MNKINFLDLIQQDAPLTLAKIDLASRKLVHKQQII